MMERIGIKFLFVLFLTYFATVGGARIPSSKLRTKHYSSVNKFISARQNEEVPTRVRIADELESSSLCMNWPKERLEVLCKPVVQCMCAVVPDENKEKIKEMKEACTAYSKLGLQNGGDICDSTKETQCFYRWWMGLDNKACFNLALDCIPYMFKDYNWMVEDI